MKSLVDFLMEKKQPNYTMDDLMKAYKKDDKGCWDIMDDIFKNSKQKKLGYIEDEKIKSFIFEKTNGKRGERKCVWYTLCLLNEKDGKYHGFECSRNLGSPNVKIGVKEICWKPGATDARGYSYIPWGLKYVDVEFSQEYIDEIDAGYDRKYVNK